MRRFWLVKLKHFFKITMTLISRELLYSLLIKEQSNEDIL